MPPLQTMDYWRVNSYGYPNFFSTEAKAQEAWETLVSFFDHDGRAYSAVKAYWNSTSAPRKLDHAAVESWKATFEEFGLLYVISRSDRVTVTPAGRQFRAAADSNDRDAFVWVGLNLLFRYPLSGPPRNRPKSPAGSSTLPLNESAQRRAESDASLSDMLPLSESEIVAIFQCTCYRSTFAAASAMTIFRLRESFPLPRN